MNEDHESSGSVSPLRLELTPRAKANLSDVLNWLSVYGEEAEVRFGKRLTEALNHLCLSVAEEIATYGKPWGQPESAASAHFARPVYRFAFHTGKTRQRRSSSGRWYVYYVLTAAEETSEGPDTLAVYAIHHGAAPPLGVSTGRIQSEEE